MKPTLATPGGSLFELGYAGQLTHDLSFQDIDHAINNTATVIDFGVVVARDGADKCKVWGADADKPLGISVRFTTAEYASGGTTGYKRYDSVPVLRSGYIYVEAAENVTVGDAALAITAQAGKIGGTTGGAAGTGRVAIPGAVWETTTASGSIGKVRINN